MINENYLRGIKLSRMPAEDSYLNSLSAVEYLSGIESLDFEKPVTFFVGENGTGKSTLLEGIASAMGFCAEGGSRDFLYSTRDTHSELSGLLTMIRTFTPKDGFFLRAESFYNTSSYLDDNSTLERYGGVSFHEQSHGEAFLSLAANRFEGSGLYILDEPEAALSPRSIFSLMVMIDALVKKKSQFIIATHSPLLMAYPDADILLFSETGIQKTGYFETDHYRITKQFMDDPERMMHYLLEDE